MSYYFSYIQLLIPIMNIFLNSFKHNFNWQFKIRVLTFRVFSHTGGETGGIGGRTCNMVVDE